MTMKVEELAAATEEEEDDDDMAPRPYQAILTSSSRRPLSAQAAPSSFRDTSINFPPTIEDNIGTPLAGATGLHRFCHTTWGERDVHNILPLPPQSILARSI